MVKLNPSSFKTLQELIESAIKAGYISIAQNEMDPKTLFENQKTLLNILDPFLRGFLSVPSPKFSQNGV